MREKAAHDTPVQEPGNLMSAALLAVSMKRYERSCATLRASRLLIHLSRIGMARGRTWLERHASPNGGPLSPGKHSPQARVAVSEEQVATIGLSIAAPVARTDGPGDAFSVRTRQNSLIARAERSIGAARFQSISPARTLIRMMLGEAARQP